MSAPVNEAPATEAGRVIRLMGFPQRIIVLLALPFGFLAGTQALTQALVIKLTGHPGFKALGIFEYLFQWLSANPAARYGAPGAGVLHWVIAAFILTSAFATVIIIVWLLGLQRKNPQLRPGQASDKEVKRELGIKQLVEVRGPKLRPSLAGTQIEPCQVGYWLGTFKGRDIWTRVEDPTILIGPSRSGKGFRFILRQILDAPGAIITTSVRLDNAKLTMRARERSGSPTLIWAPGIEGAKEAGTPLRHNPVVGCTDEDTLVRRVKSMVPSGAFSGSTTNGGHWDTLGQQLAAHLFHAAACGGKDVDTIWDWVMNPVIAKDAARLIREHPEGMLEHASHLEYVLSLPHESLGSTWGTLATSLSFMESRAARWWMKPEPGQQVDLAEFVLQRGSLYIVGDKMAASQYTRLNDWMLAEFDFITKGLAAASPGSRLDPPVSYILDEAGNIEYQGMYELITAGGGYGRVAIVAYQSKNQLDQVGDQSTAATLWDAAVAKIILPGGGDTKALDEISQLIGDVWVERVSDSIGSGDPSSQYSTEQRAAFSKKDIREMSQKYAFVFYRNLAPIVIETGPFTDHPRYKECMQDSRAIDQGFQRTSRFAGYLAPETARA